jgi:alcohol dehydrogenase
VKAIWLEQATGSPRIVDRPEPVAAASGVVVTVIAVRVPSYTRGVFDGSLGYDLPMPFIPGPTCIGRIESVGEDVFDLLPGQTALCNSLLSSGELGGDVDDILIGWTGAGSERSRRMQEQWHDGSFAQKAHYPARCVTPLADAERFDPSVLPFLASLAIADGGLNRGGLRGGETLLVSGATGQLGSAAILVALARGAARLIAAGRDAAKLAALAELSPRVTPCVLSGDRAQDAAQLRKLSEGGAHLAVDYLAHTPTPNATLAAIDALRIGGTAVLVGGVRHELPLPYGTIMRRQLTIRGSFMFGRETVQECWQLARAGAIDLNRVRAHSFRLDQIERAMEVAASVGGFEIAVLRPDAG